MPFETVSDQRSFGGRQLVVQHDSAATSTPMRAGIYLPPQGASSAPVLFFLSGLTCTEQNVVTKGGFQGLAAELGMVVVCPDTSPRGEEVADDEAYDLGKGAGFYLDATQAPWARHYQMERYVMQELPAVVAEVRGGEVGRFGLTGHSMGGHGALTLALRHPEQVASVSAFAPICAPTQCPWGTKALSAYLGDDRAAWEAHDAAELLKRRGWHGDVLVDQGLADGFLESQLHPHLLEAAAGEVGVPLTLRRHEGYDHSYFFIATFLGDHLRWHRERLG